MTRNTTPKERKHSASRLIDRENLLKYTHSQNSWYYYEVKGGKTVKTPLIINRAKRLDDIRSKTIQVSQEECARLRESVPFVKLYRYNPKNLYPKLNGYGVNGQRSLKLWQLLLTYWLPNTYWNWQEYVVTVMLISVLNIKVTCEWHKAIKLNYKNTRTHVIVVLRVTKHCT